MKFKSKFMILFEINVLNATGISRKMDGNAPLKVNLLASLCNSKD